MVFQSGADDLLAVVQVVGTDEADDRVDQQRTVAPRDGVGARFAGLLVDAVMRVGGEGASLPRLEIHDVFAALQLTRGLARLVEHREINTEGRVRRLSS